MSNKLGLNTAFSCRSRSQSEGEASAEASRALRSERAALACFTATVAMRQNDFSFGLKKCEICSILIPLKFFFLSLSHSLTSLSLSVPPSFFFFQRHCEHAKQMAMREKPVCLSAAARWAHPNQSSQISSQRESEAHKENPQKVSLRSH